jgi:hypothetical protein
MPVPATVGTTVNDQGDGMPHSPDDKETLTVRKVLLAMLISIGLFPLLLSAWVVRSITDGQTAREALREGFLPLLIFTAAVQILEGLVGWYYIRTGKKI